MNGSKQAFPTLIQARSAGIGVAALALLWLAMLLLGAGDVDRSVLLALYAGERPWVALISIGITYLGNWQTLLTVALLGAAWLLISGRYWPALILMAATLSGRGLVTLQKLELARLRPEENMRLIEVSTLSFPSGHAANSMITYPLLAALVVPPRHRAKATVAGILLSILIGMTRPMLGVHWPSDVIGGWSFGLIWLLLWVRLMERDEQRGRLNAE